MTRKFKKSGCKRFRALIQKRLDGCISPEENIELDEHLSVCSECLDELTSLAQVQDLLSESRENPTEVPGGFFESLATKLDGIAPARGWQGILAHPFFTTYRNMALAATSIVLVAILTLSVGTGALTRLDGSYVDKAAPVDADALIMTNSGDAMILQGDKGDPERYARALDDLEAAYAEALGKQSDEDSDAYVYTSWQDGESASPSK